MSSPLEDALVDFFRQATVSSTIVNRLASAGEPIEHDLLLEEVNNMMIHLVPDYKFAASSGAVMEHLHSFEPTVQTGLNLLLESGIVMQHGTLCTLSEVGRELHERIKD
jgi:hypothetical protein